MNDICISPSVSVRDAIDAVDRGGQKTVFVVDKERHLLGLFTDGDMRRFILHNGDMQQPVAVAMNPHPVVFHTREAALEARDRERMVVYPIVNDEHILLDAVFWAKNKGKNVISTALVDVPLVMMAGGKGTRLYPYTKVLPKPLIPIGDITISERIINNFVRYGCRDVWMVLNYKGNMIKSYYDDLHPAYSIHYVKEKEFLGTGGGLSLLKGKVASTVFVSNCDILVDADLECIYKVHKKNHNKITLVSVMKNMQIPYGVINLDAQGNIESMTEKPKFSFLTNTGVYVLEPEVIESIPDNHFIHLPDIVQRYLDAGERVGIFPVSENMWLDMGQLSEMEDMIKKLGL
ncbi:sugar phosphate nucleotidyltransferase [Selenomonas bovis]|uniref:sugar phosphate nucleotidyltransferase n=1 Tax=Selenomonas bovis TaxID=416586 RepID=UPI0009DBBCA4|nr:sugar phosphate nucleotidyltransferase [Selenomonas bovis]